MAVIGRFAKQPREIIDIDISLQEFFSARNDTLDRYDFIIPGGITKKREEFSDNVIKIFIEGGEVTDPNEPFKIELFVTTSSCVIIEDEILIDVVEV